MIEVGQIAPPLNLKPADGKPCLLVFIETDCPTCRLSIPYLNRLAEQTVQVVGISQDSETLTRQFVEQTTAAFPVEVDRDLQLSRAFDPQAVPAFVLVGADGCVKRAQIGFDKDELNAIAAEMGGSRIAEEHDGAPQRKPGCSSRHLEPSDSSASPEPLKVYAAVGARASRARCLKILMSTVSGNSEIRFPYFPLSGRVERLMRGLDPAQLARASE